LGRDAYRLDRGGWPGLVMTIDWVKARSCSIIFHVALKTCLC
jgi:hypothetical protein